MRILPLAFTDCRYQMVNAVSGLTHAHEISLEACRIYISVARKLLRGKPLANIVQTIKPELPVYARLPKLDTLQRDEIQSSGYVVKTQIPLAPLPGDWQESVTALAARKAFRKNGSTR